jgi:hypothetical protein
MFRGLHEGTNMYMEGDKVGVRCHAWFWFYHRMGDLRDLSGILVGYAAARSPVWSTVVLLTGAIVAHWQGYEMFYSYARYRTFLPVTENFLGLGIYLDSTDTLIAHILRYVGAITLIIVGIYK